MLYRCGGGGGSAFKSGTFTMPGVNNTVTITTGFKPNYIAYFKTTSGSATIYNKDYSTSKACRCTSSGVQDSGSFGTQNYGIDSITNTGFVVRGGSNTGTYYYFAIG